MSYVKWRMVEDTVRCSDGVHLPYGVLMQPVSLGEGTEDGGRIPQKILNSPLNLNRF